MLLTVHMGDRYGWCDSAVVCLRKHEWSVKGIDKIFIKDKKKNYSFITYIQFYCAFFFFLGLS